MNRLSDRLRSLIPLPLRRLVGPYIGYVAYFVRTRFKGPTWVPIVLSPEDTLNKIRAEEMSLIRFGDGELSLLSGLNLGFQKYDRELAEKMRSVITSDHPKLLIGIPGIFGRLEHFAPLSFWFEIHHLFRYGKLWRELVRPNRVYGDAFITRPYLSYKDRNGAAAIYRSIKTLWAERDIILIEGEKSRLGVNNDLFAEVKSLRRVLGPAENAFAQASDIISSVSTLPKDNLVLLSLGPAAKVIGYELFQRGYRVLDIGHLDMEYEMFLRQSDHLVAVPYKYFNEIAARNPEDCVDPKYQSEIIAKFT